MNYKYVMGARECWRRGREARGVHREADKPG